MKEVYERITALIDTGCRFEGEIYFEGVVRINGTIKGKICSSDTLIIGEGGRIEGTIEVGMLESSGVIKGEVLAHRKVVLKQPGVFQGKIRTPVLSIEEGVLFEGQTETIQAQIQLDA